MTFQDSTVYIILNTHANRYPYKSGRHGVMEDGREERVSVGFLYRVRC